MKFSVVIVTYQRHIPLCDTLRDLASHINPSIGEVIVIDQCPTAPLPIDVLAIPGLRYIVLDLPGMVIARNVGLRTARGSIVLFLDDDVVPTPELISAHLGAYIASTIGGVAGRILDHDHDHDHTPSPHPMVFDPVDGWRYAHFDHAVSGDVMTARGCNMSFRRELLARLGGFDPNFAIFRDDTDMCLRVIAAGYVIRFVPAAGLVHLNSPTGGTRSHEAAEDGYWGRELRMYRQHYRHYRDNLYFILKHRYGTKRLKSLVDAYRNYVGLSRWPWRLTAKNVCFFVALLRAAHLARSRRQNSGTF